jgi:hypothetical protein
MKKLLPYSIVLFLTLFCFLIHFSEATNLMLNDNNNDVSNQYLTIVVDYHKSNPEFQKRPITTFLIEKTVQITDIRVGEAFILINFLFLFISGILIYHISLLFEKNSTIAIVNVLIYFTCFSNLFAFFPPVYTYDEPIQFCLILLGMLFIYRAKWWGYIIFFSLSLIARESGLILLPGLLLICIYKEGDFIFKKYISKKNFLKLLYLMIPAVLYLLYLIIFIEKNNITPDPKTDLLSRFSLYAFNTQTQKYAFESLISFFLVLGLPLYFLINGVKNRGVYWTKYHKYVNAFLLTVIINSVIVLFLTQAREVRLFVIPMLFIWPIFSRLFIEDLKLLISIKQYISTFSKLNYVAFFAFLNFLNYTLSFKVYETTIGSPSENYFNEYLFIILFVILTHATLKHNLKTSLTKSKLY